MLYLKVQSAKCKVQSAKCKVQSARRESGFTLVELSIVIVIIGLIVAGVVGGQVLVKQAKLRSIGMDYQNLDRAYTEFVGIQNELPGDFTKAHAVYDNGSNTVCGTATQCNGNGNRKLDFSGGGTGNVTNDTEILRAGQHLYLEGLINQNLSGSVAVAWSHRAGVDVYASKFGGDTAFVLAYFTFEFPSSTNKNFIVFAKPNTNAALVTGSAIMYNDVVNLDKKFDDGTNNGRFTYRSGFGEILPCNASATTATCISAFDLSVY